MGQNSSAIRPSRSSDRSPRSLTPPPGQHSPFTSGNKAVGDTSETYLSPPSAQYHHTTSLHPNHPSPNTYAAESSISSHHELELSRHQDPLFALQPADLSQPPLAARPYPPHPTINISHPDPAIPQPTYLLSNSQPFHAASPATTLRQPITSTYEVDQEPLRNPQGEALTIPVLSPAPAQYNHPSTFHSYQPSPSLQPIYAVQPSTFSPCGLELPGYQKELVSQQPGYLARIPVSQGSYHPLDPPTPQSPYPLHPTANSPYLDPAISYPIHSLSNSQSLHAALPSNTLYRPGKSTYENRSADQRPLQLLQGQALNIPVSQSARYQSQGMFSGSHDLSFRDNTFIDNSITSDNFMKEFLRHTIIGAEYDSSDRHPPPRCHPGTRLAIVERCKTFIECNGKEKMRWVVGPAGVGKSAIMQMVAEETPADASVFFSVNGRRDGTKTFTTIAYQLAAKYEPYRQFIRNEISRDPSLFRKSLPVQFQKFIIEPFIHRHTFNPPRRFVVIIDGLDECDDPLTQVELLELISQFCITYPTSPIVWFIASRPEPHITSFFDDVSVTPAHSKEEIVIDSNEACNDVQLYLRDELNKVKRTYPTLKRKREWPSEFEFTKIATAAGGLFAYASTVVRYIGDPHYRDPAAQLRHVLEEIEASPKDDTSRSNHPMALLDALYQRILSNVPPDVMINTRKLLLACSPDGGNQAHFRMQCNKLGLTEDTAYGAVSHLHAVVKVPAPDMADGGSLTYFHKSFMDFLFDFKRSRLYHNAMDEVAQLLVQSSLGIIEHVPDNFGSVTGTKDIESSGYGSLKSSRGFCDKIPLSWPGDERFRTTDSELRVSLYHDSMNTVCQKFKAYGELYWNISIFQPLITRFSVPDSRFPFYELRECSFDKLRSELTALNEFKQVPLRMLDYAAICGWIDFRFMGPVGVDGKHSDPWNPSCKHRKRDSGGGGGGLQPSRRWSTSFHRSLGEDGVGDSQLPRFGIQAGKDSHWKSVDHRGFEECPDCSRRLAQHFIDNQDQLVTVFVDSTGMCYVELSFVDPDDGVSEWRYRFFHSGPPSSSLSIISYIHSAIAFK